MIFHTVHKFIDDVSLLGSKGKIGTLGENETSRTGVAVRITMQVILSLTVIAVSAWILTRSQPSEGAMKWAHTGLGLVLGYWFR